MTDNCPTCETEHRQGFQLSRRNLLTAAGAATALMAMPGAKLSFASDSTGTGRTLIVLYLRGGADGLSLVPPVGDSSYYKLRPSIAVPQSKALMLDRMWALHPAMKSLLPYYQSGKLAVVHAAGDPDNTRSHFDMEDATERWAKPGTSTANGWVSNWLIGRREGVGPFPSLTVGDTVPVSLQGSAPAVAMNSIDDFSLNVSEKDRPRLQKALSRMYGHARADLREPAKLAISTINKLQPYRDEKYVPGNGATYPTTGLGQQLSQVALLLHAKVGLSAVALDVGGWDMHVAMGGVGGGLMVNQAQMLSDALAAFAQDLGSRLDDVTVVTMSEFGRTAAENGSNGTDHGMGNCMFILGRTPRAYKGGQVTVDYAGLAGTVKDTSLDLPITVDYRDVLRAVISTVG